MSLSAAELEAHCQAIIDLSQRKCSLIVLCEGNIHKIKGRIEKYRRLEIFPDADFYKACVPIWWTGKRPTFVPCGDRKDVIDTFFALRKLGFDQKRLFAIIDLDLQPHPLADYVAADTEALFALCYRNGKFQKTATQQPGLFITGLIYKEAYFLVPDLQTLFDNYSTSILFDGNQLNLPNLYRIMANALPTDNNLSANFQRACARIRHLETLDYSNPTALQQSWPKAFDEASESKQEELVYALLCIHQVKEYWQKFTPVDTIPKQRFEEQLTLAIGQFYAQQPQGSEHHIPCFFAAMETKITAKDKNND